MEGKNKLPFYIKICTFHLLTWICNFYIDQRNSYNFLNKMNNIDIKLVTRTYRLLGKRKWRTCSYNTLIKEEIPNNVEYEKKDMYNNEKLSKGKNKILKEYSLNNSQDYGQSSISKSSVRNRENSYYGKRMLDKIYYKNKVKDSINADFMFLKKDILHKLGALCFLFIFIATFAILILGYRLFRIYMAKKTTTVSQFSLHPTSTGLLLLGIIVIPLIIYIGRKLITNVKLTYKKCELNNTAYPCFRKVFFL
ncbi:hypothetical protein MKS88_004045 [Plasmodium brasilianum]|uniref:Uncharacterized protein n=1 Tax=Plasmodium brasilianum TaxID=5824 RepID=A0ACB9Y676_PLABR|nr:hypothetical protein MKS88_004045 [Plasmodium brasilianum]